MTKEEFWQLSAAENLILDGATGSNLRKMGMPAGICTELWILEHPETLQQLQRDFAAAGSRIVYAPTFGANRMSMARFGYEGDITELNRRLVDVTRGAGLEGVLIGGDMSTTGQLLEPRGELTYEKLYEVYQEQAQALADCGVDLIAAETMLTIEELTVLLDAVQSVCDLAVLCTLTVESDGSLLYGGHITEAVETLQEMGAAAVGVNCSLGPDQLEAVTASMKRVAKVPVIVKPNAGIPTIDAQGTAHYSMGPEAFATAMQNIRKAGADIVGGCCGTTPEYIRLLKSTV
ncbi:MAG: homocysteine S-methyltransferase family protein [Eubacteriales bacterium]|nr:homocysteine S-methyltransferase family protein [Eubacteriales bacterium]